MSSCAVRTEYRGFKAFRGLNSSRFCASYKFAAGMARGFSWRIEQAYLSSEWAGLYVPEPIAVAFAAALGIHRFSDEVMRSG